MSTDILYDYYEKLISKYHKDGKIKCIELIRAAKSVEEAMAIYEKYHSLTYASYWPWYELKGRVESVLETLEFLRWLKVPVPKMSSDIKEKIKEIKRIEKERADGEISL